MTASQSAIGHHPLVNIMGAMIDALGACVQAGVCTNESRVESQNFRSACAGVNMLMS